VGRCEALARRLAAGERWDLVFNFCEGARGRSREAQVPALLECFDIPCTFCDPLTACITLDKSIAKRVVRDAGFPTADFLVVEEVEDLAGLALPFPVFAKPVAEGTGKGVTARSKIKSPVELKEVCADLLRTYKQPVLVETYLAGREFTVGIVGTGDESEVVGVIEVLLKENAEAEVYSYANKENCEDLVLYRLADGEIARLCKETALKAWRGLGCRDAGRIDLRLDSEGLPNFLEVNPLAGLHPEHSDLPIICTYVGIPYRELIGRIMTSVLRRIRP
jgi:D-alanine-D-alanine ligase